MDRCPSDCWYLTGPTATGKTRLAVLVARRLEAEIIAMDSMTLYRGMDIGTAKPSLAELSAVPHHLVNVLEPWESGTVDWYLRQAHQAIATIRSRGKRPLFVGGTPLYLKACLRGLFEGPPAQPKLRAHFEREAELRGTAFLHRRLQSIDPAAARVIQPGDLRRILRALEVFQVTGKPISQLQEQFARPADPPPRVACIMMPREELHGRIDRRVEAMLAAGWIDEVRRLTAGDRPLSREAAQAVGIRELSAYLRGELDLANATQRIQTRTHQFGKRQRTWFRHIPECSFLAIRESDEPEAVADRLIEFYTGPAPVDSAPVESHPDTSPT